MNVSDESLGHEGRLEARVGVQSGVAVSYPKHVADPIVVSELEEPRPDDVVESRGKPPAGDERRGGFSDIVLLRLLVAK